MSVASYKEWYTRTTEQEPAPPLFLFPASFEGEKGFKASAISKLGGACDIMFPSYQSLKRRKCDNERHNFMERLLGAARLLAEMVEPILKVAMYSSTDLT